MGLIVCMPSTFPTFLSARMENPVSSVEEDVMDNLARPEVFSNNFEIEPIAAWFVERIASNPATPRMIPNALKKNRKDRERMERKVSNRVRRISRLQVLHRAHDAAQPVG
jgi:hypothetical protein